jgi:hypothetical protein
MSQTMFRMWTMFRNWFLEGLPDVLRVLALLPFAYVVFGFGLLGGAVFAEKPTGTTCGTPMVAPMMAGGLGALLAFRVGVWASRLVRGSIVGALALTVFVSPFALIAVSRGDFEFAVRGFGGAVGIGSVSGALGGLLAFLLWPTEFKGGSVEPTVASMTSKNTGDQLS